MGGGMDGQRIEQRFVSHVAGQIPDANRMSAARRARERLVRTNGFAHRALDAAAGTGVEASGQHDRLGG